MIALRHVLVATDFSEASDAALEYGRQFARMFGATLHVMHVVENVMARFAADAYPVLLPDLQRDVEEAGAKKLMGLITSEDTAQLHAVSVVRTSTSPAAAIVDYAKEAGIDLVDPRDARTGRRREAADGQRRRARRTGPPHARC